MESNYICHSGGCPGADMEWEKECELYGIPTIAYSFPKHIQEGKNPKILTQEELDEGWEQVLKCEKLIKRPLHNIKYNYYVKNLLCRNWFQVKNSDAIYAIGKLVGNSERLVDGGTGWAVQMAINNKKVVWLFEQNLNQWFAYVDKIGKFVDFQKGVSPKLINSFAGIGTRKINDYGKQAIKEILKFNLDEH